MFKKEFSRKRKNSDNTFFLRIFVLFASISG